MKTNGSNEQTKPNKLMKVLFTTDEQACVKLVANMKSMHANEYMRAIVVAQAKKDITAMDDKISKLAGSILNSGI